MKKSVLREYAKLIVRCGVNIQKGQDLLVYAGLEQPEFVQMVVEEAYKAKARKVIVEWSYDPLAKIHVRSQSVKTLGEVTEWQKARQQYFCDTLPARLHLVSEDPDGLKGMNIKKMTKDAKEKLYKCPSDSANFASEAMSYYNLILIDDDTGKKRLIVGRDNPGAATWMDLHKGLGSANNNHPTAINIGYLGGHVGGLVIKDTQAADMLTKDKGPKFFDQITY